MSSANVIINYNQFEQDRISFTEFKESGKQEMAYVHYNHPTMGEGQQLLLQLPWQKIFDGGVPSLGEFYETDKDRAFMKFPIDLESAEITQVWDELNALDSRMSSKETREALFGAKGKKYKYVPLCKTPDEKTPFIKFKIDLSWPDGDVKTKVYSSEMVNVLDEDDNQVLDDEGNPVMKRQRTDLEVSTVTEFAQHVKYMSTVRLIVRPVKLWAQSSKLPEPNYGIIFKLFKVEVEKNPSSGKSLDAYLDDAFLDSDTEELPETTSAKKASSKTAVAAESESEQESEEESEESEESEEEAPPSPVVKKGGRRKAKTSTK